jgi:hypothetical protein
MIHELNQVRAALLELGSTQTLILNELRALSAFVTEAAPAAPTALTASGPLGVANEASIGASIEGETNPPAVDVTPVQAPTSPVPAVAATPVESAEAPIGTGNETAGNTETVGKATVGKAKSA